MDQSNYASNSTLRTQQSQNPHNYYVRPTNQVFIVATRTEVW